MPDPNACIMRKCRVFPVEFVCRGFMTGSTDTSLWTHYKVRARWWQLGLRRVSGIIGGASTRDVLGTSWASC